MARLRHRSKLIILTRSREASFWSKEAEEQWHSAGIGGKKKHKKTHTVDHVDPHIRGAGEILDGVFRLGDTWETKVSSTVNTVTDQLVLVTLKYHCFLLGCRRRCLYTHAGSLHV